MDTTIILMRLAFIAALSLGLVSAQAKPTASASNSKGFAAPKYNGTTATVSSSSETESDDEEEEDDDDAPRGKSSAKIPVGYRQQGIASFYGGYWNGRKTADGEIYNQNTLTAAHKSLPFNSRVRVRNLLNNREVVVRINNRGPYRKGRIIDLSVAAAKKIDIGSRGVVPVEIEVIR